MTNKIRFSIAKQDIVEHFSRSGRIVYSRDDISDILEGNRDFWRLTQSLTVDQFIDLLRENTILKRHCFRFKSMTITRYSWGKADIIDLALSFRKGAYLTHYSAVSYHGLTEQFPKAIYINVEQSEKEKMHNELSQPQIDHAMQKPTRLSNNYANYRGRTVYMLNGEYTDSLGVLSYEADNLPVTDMERTLIDITVRPEYSGGIYEVLQAFEFAAGQVSINKLLSYLKRLNYVYPYHQCIGFYMKTAGNFSNNQIDLVRKIEKPYRFYLIHGMEEKTFSKEWNLYYPANLSI